MINHDWFVLACHIPICHDRHLIPDCIPYWLILFKLFITCYPSTCNILIDILVYSIVSTLLFCSFYFHTCIFLYLYHYMLICYMHVYLPLYSYTFIGSSNSLDLHIQVFACYLTDQVFGEDHRHLEESWVLSIRLLVFSVSFIPSFSEFLIYWTHYLFYFFIHLLSCVVIHMLYCSVIMSS